MRIVLTGASGQFGRAFLDLAMPHEVLPLVHTSADLDVKATPVDLAQPKPVADLIVAQRPDWVVHAAGVTNVDDCERDPQRAHLINGEATGVLARACKAAGSRLLYVSTDYVFDGQAGDYAEGARTGPINEYGRSKLEGERRAVAELPNALVCRTSVVFGPHKKNFVTWCARELAQNRPIRVVTDQVVTPTYTYDLARQALRLVEEWAEGIYHTAGGTRLSRFDMANQVAQAYALDPSLIQPVLSSDLTWLARRPRDSSLSTRKVSSVQRPMPLGAALQDLKRRWTPT